MCFCMLMTPYFCSETAKDTQNALDATLSYREQNNISKKIVKTKYMIVSRGKTRKYDAITTYGQTIERVDTFCYLGVVFR